MCLYVPVVLYPHVEDFGLAHFDRTSPTPSSSLVASRACASHIPSPTKQQINAKAQAAFNMPAIYTCRHPRME